MIDVEKPKTVALNKYKTDAKPDDGAFYQGQPNIPAQYKSNQNAKPNSKPSSKLRDQAKKDLDAHNPTIFEIQRDENGALKVVTSKEDTNREKKMVGRAGHNILRPSLTFNT